MVRIGTWNVENLFRPGEQDGPSSQAAYEAKLDALAGTIKAIDAATGPEVAARSPRAAGSRSRRQWWRRQTRCTCSWHTVRPEMGEPAARGTPANAPAP